MKLYCRADLESMNYRSQTLSAVLITRNNAPVIERALESLDWVDEIVAVDQGSTDGTVKLLRRYTDKVYYHPSNDPTLLRQHALAQATQDWVLFLEPHEWVEEMLRHKIDGVLLNPNGEEGFTIPLKFYWQGRYLRRGGMTKRELRLFRRNKALAQDHVYFRGYNVEGSVKALDEAIGSEPYRDIEEMVDALNDLSTRAAYRVVEEKGYAAQGKAGQAGFQGSSLNLLVRPVCTFFYRSLFLGALQEGMAGMGMAFAQSYHCFLKYAKYRDLLSASAQPLRRKEATLP
jgi:glycosyltransferase involved in cell wall biosynthesis